MLKFLPAVAVHHEEITMEEAEVAVSVVKEVVVSAVSVLRQIEDQLAVIVSATTVKPKADLDVIVKTTVLFVTKENRYVAIARADQTNYQR